MLKRICRALPALFTAAALLAQSTTGRISGTVSDSSGAIIPGAGVTARNEGTGQSWKAHANERGFYVIPTLPVGTYAVEVEVTGFQKARKTGIALDADARLTADFTLSPGQLTERVEVVAAAGETVNTTSGEISRVIDSAQVEDLALNGRNYMQLVTLIPGVALLDEDQMAVTTSLSTANQSVNGNRTNSNMLAVDGGYNMDSGSNASQINNVAVDFIREVKVQTSNFSAEFGRQSGASINVVTKSGENRFHGSLFENLRNDKLDARSFFAPRKGMLRFNNFGWSLGGPVQKDKVFFFAGQEWKKIRRDSEPVRRTLPVRAQRAGDFTGQTVYYPGTKTPVPDKNMAPLATADGRAIMKTYDALEKLAASYSDSTGGNNAIFQMSNPFDAREDMIRLDYRLGDRHSFYTRYIKDTYNLVDPFGGADLPLSPQNNQRPGATFQLAYTFVPSATTVNEAKFNSVWSRQRLAPFGDSWQRSVYGFTFPEIFPGGGRFSGSIPDIQPSGVSYIKGAQNATASGFTDFAFHDNFTWVRGRHTFKAGAVVIRDRKDQDARAYYAGLVKFDPKGNAKTTNNAIADALTGNFRTYREADWSPVGFLRFSQFENYVMDSWKIARNLSLEIGVRHQYGIPTYAQANNMVNFDPRCWDPAKAVSMTRDGFVVPNSGFIYNGLVRVGDGIPKSELARVPSAMTAEVASVPAGAPRGFFNPAHLFAPRFGFAWAPHRKTAVRGGFGMYFNRPENSMISSALSTPPYLRTAQVENGNLADPSGGQAAALSAMDTIYSVDPRLRSTYTMNFSVSVQRELPRGFFIEAGYVGNLGRHLQRAPDINQPTWADYQYIGQFPSNSRPPVNSYRRYKGYSAIYMRWSDSNSNYNALQLYIAKRKGNLMFTASYTFSKALADASKNSEDPEDPFNRKFNYGPASFDRRHIFVTTYTYRLPVLRQSHAILRWAFGGWELSGITRAQSGQNLSVTSDSAAGERRADYIGGPVDLPDSEKGPNLYFNTAAFVTPPFDRRGTSGVGIVHGPGLYLWDMTPRKVFTPSERFKLRFQADFVNAMNHANFRNLATKTSSKDFGQIREAGPPRNIQFGLKLIF